jgi:hypothetical protein
MIVMYVSLPIILYLIYTYTTDTNYFMEDTVIPPQRIEEAMLAAGLVTEKEVDAIIEKELEAEKPAGVTVTIANVEA